MDIRLLVTDMDGTLLNDRKEIDPSFWPMHQRLKEREILFAVASGRQVFSLEKSFADIREHTLFIGDNGTYVRYRGADVFVNPMPTDDFAEILMLARKIEDAEVVLCCKNAAYIECKRPDFYAAVQEYFHKLEVVDDLAQVQDEVLKFAIYDYKNAENNSYVALGDFHARYKVTVSGPEWVDVTARSANKGHALEKVMQKMNLQAENVMAFGDFMNDLEMMKVAGHSFAMKNAHPGILEAACYITEKDNNHNGVVDTVERLLLQPQAATFSRE